jgi:isopenicillin N synthase-like dioxygenase
MHGNNNWPEALSSSSSSIEPVAALREKLQRYWDQCTAVSLEIARALALSLGLDEHFFTRRMDKAVAQMVLLRYPPPPAGSHQAGCGAHTDCGFLTLLQQDLDGLEIKDKQGNWVEAPRLERQGVDGVMLVNLGDMAARWSNGLYKSTWHRVNNKTGRLRHSIPFFCNTNFDALVDPKSSVCAGSLSGVVGEARFEPVGAGQYLCEKLGLMWGDDKI